MESNGINNTKIHKSIPGIAFVPISFFLSWFILQNRKLGKSFRYAAPVVWNRLPRSIRESVCVDTFKTRLKTLCFKMWLAD